MTFLVNGFIVIFLIFAWSWNDLPDLPLTRFVKRFGKQISWLGLRHNWSMFAPKPIHVERRLQAEIRLKNGDTMLWKAVRLENLSKWQAFLKARDRKHQTQVFRRPRLRPALVKYVSRIYRERGYAVQEVRLVRIHRLIPGPRDRDPTPRPFKKQVLYTYLPGKDT